MAREEVVLPTKPDRGPQSDWISSGNHPELENAIAFSEGYPAAGACPQHVPKELWADQRGEGRSAARVGSSATHAPNVQLVKACFQK